MITLSSDFGWPYPAAMRGVMLGRSDARLVDVTHAFPRGDVRTAAFWLREILPWFPAAVHLAVVDPGVGTERDVLAIEAGEHVLVGPDNGLLLPVARRLADDIAPYALEAIDAESHTFHGRDVFAPLAAEVHEQGIDAVADLQPAGDVVDLTFPAAELTDEGAIGEVLVVDVFGNAITNIPGDALDGRYGETISVNGRGVPVRRTYGAVESGEALLTVGSHGNVELAVRDDRGADAFDVSVGSAVELG